MRTSLSEQSVDAILLRLRQASQEFSQHYPGESARRQPVHTVYGGAHLFRSDTAQRLGTMARQALAEYAPDFVTFAQALRLSGADSLRPEETESLTTRLTRNAEEVRRENRPAWLAWTVYTRVLDKLQREPVEDFRLDFEDGYGNRPDDEEDGHAAAAAVEVARGMAANTLPPFIGIRLKPLNEELKTRSIRTLDIFITTLLEQTGGRLPAEFLITLPKVVIPDQVAALADLFDLLEAQTGLPAGTLRMELMIETTQSLINERGETNLPRLLAAARGRCVAAHFGTYDYTASCSITAAHQHMLHPACDFARHLMQVAFAGTGIWLSDGATNIMPVPPHRASAGQSLSPAQIARNREVVHHAWQLHFAHIQHSLVNAFYQGWDLHPAQLPSRYAAVYAFFLENPDAAAERLRNFVAKAAQATLVGDVFDDAATGQGLLNYFLRAINCGALTGQEATELTSLTLEELRSGSFVKILKNRQT
ncbi:MAG TPA: phosphoenolpyruvate kinase [Blastocatellia bacterium]|nr:phosphoenolpyruvate kinase [Blastocatellia bacterium]